MKKQEMNAFKSICRDYLVFNQLVVLVILVLLLYIPLQMIRKFYSDRLLNRIIDYLEMKENSFIFKQRI